MSHECKHCKKVFSNKYIMKNHQKTAKYCLKIQGTKESNLNKFKFKCGGCHKSFTRKNHYTSHISSCKEIALKNKDDEIRKLKKNKDVEIRKLKKNKDDEIRQLKKINKNIIKRHKREMKAQKTEYKQEIAQLQEKVQELAKVAIEKPTNNTTNNNHILNLTPFLMDDTNIKNKIDNYYNMDYLKRGQRGVAEFTKDNILMDDEGKLKYICSDAARMIFKYKDQDGEMRKDVKANKLSKKITPKILKKATDIITTDVSNRRDEDGIEHVMDSYKGLFSNIQRMDNNPGILGNELSQLTT